MNILNRYITIIALLFVVTATANAGQVNSTFATGDTLTATGMTEIKDAVNDNESRINSLENNSSDTLSALACSAGQVAKHDGTNWACALDVDTDTNTDALSALNCSNGQVAKWGGSSWACATDTDTNTDALAALTCTSGEVAKYNGISWACAADNNSASTDTLSGLICTSGEVAKYIGTAWVCAPDDNTDTTYTGSVAIDITGSVISIPAGGVTGLEIAAGTITAADIDSTSIQERLNAGCTGNAYLQGIAADGTPTCTTATDSDTTYTAGSGLSLAAGSFSSFQTSYKNFTGLNITSAASVGTTYVKLEDVGTFTKSVADTSIEASFNSHVDITSATSSSANIQLRLNDVTASIGGNMWVKYATSSNFYSFDGVFTGLAAGTYTLSIWVRATTDFVDTLTVDSGGWGGQILLKEAR